MEKSVWDLIKAGEFEAACKAADEEIVASDSTFPMRNKIIALLNLSAYQDVISLSELVIEKNGGSTDVDFIFLGVAHWLQGEKNKAIDAWRRSASSRYADAAGGVATPLLLLYAAERCGLDDVRKESLKMLKKLCKPASTNRWPGPVAKFVLGYMDERTMRERISEQPMLASRETCQADFYVGVMNLAKGELSSFSAMMERAVSHGPVTLLASEYYLARCELLESKR